MVLNQFQHILRHTLALIDHTVYAFLTRNRLQPEFLYLLSNSNQPLINHHRSPPPTIQDILGDGFLWAVPKSRRTIEKRLKRKFGHPDYVWKMLVPKSNLQVCNTCGDDHEIGVLCPTCYKRVIDETHEMQQKIESELKLSPVEKEVVVLYEGEKDEFPTEFYQGKRIVEMEKPRPNWFSKNLLQKTTQQPTTEGDVNPVKPSDLG